MVKIYIQLCPNYCSMNLSNLRTLPGVHTVRQSECDSASPQQPELTSALGAAISATKTISFRYLLTGLPLSSAATAATLASSKPPFGAGRGSWNGRTDFEAKRKPFLRRRMSMYSIQTVLSRSLRLSFSPLKVWKRRRKEMRGRNPLNAEKISGSETATASGEREEEAEE